jgi:hypothetical protein
MPDTKARRKYFWGLAKIGSYPFSGNSYKKTFPISLIYSSSYSSHSKRYSLLYATPNVFNRSVYSFLKEIV